MGALSGPRRREDWPERLAEAEREARRKTFRWGEFDCCIYAADLVRAMTDTDPMAAFRGRYDSEETARALLDRAGGLRKAIGSALGEHNRIRREQALRGDVVFLRLETGGYAVGISFGGMASFAAPTGHAWVPIEHCADFAWRVPR